jgi:tetratricopeptide (TPR) repeat protein
MPPWKPEPGYGEFANARRLADEQVALIAKWVEQGAIRGDPRDLPAPRFQADGWQLGQPDLVVSLPAPYVLSPGRTDVFRTFVLPAEVPAARYVRGVELRLGNRATVHHANIKIDRTRSSRRLDEREPEPGYEGSAGQGARFPDGHFLGWTLGQQPRFLGDDMVWRLEPGSDIVVEMHMVPAGRLEQIELSVGLFLTDRPTSRVPSMLRLGRQDIDIAPGDGEYVSTDSYVLPVDVEVLAVQPHAHSLAKEIRGVALLPDGSTKWLIYIRRWDFHWQDVYQYAAPIHLPKETRLEMRYTYDNSARNPENPNRPPRRVTFGQSTDSEMGDLWLQVVTRDARDRSALEQDYAPKMLREDITGAEKTLEMNSLNEGSRIDLALLYIEAGRVADAMPHLEAAVRLQPKSPEAQYHLGTALLTQSRFDEAAGYLGRAVQVRHDFPEAWNNLGVARYARGQIVEAIVAYRKAVELETGHREAHFNLARALAFQGSNDEAVSHYREAVRIRPDAAEIHASLASALAKLGRLDEAIVHYRRALQLEPDLPAALVDLSWILSASSRPDVKAPREAVGLAERAAEITNYKDPTVLETLAVAYAASERLQDAVRAAEMALDAAERSGLEALVAELRRRLETYRSELALQRR